MSSDSIKPKDDLPEGYQVDVLKPKDEVHQGAEVGLPEEKEVLADPDLMNDAFDGENREHEMGLWTAVKSHPWACFWAFIMCFTIVSLIPCIRIRHSS